MEGRVTCNEEKCQQTLERAQINTEAPTTTSRPELLETTSFSSRSNIADFGDTGETGEKGITGNMGSPGEL